MIAKRRARKRSLIRSHVMNTAMPKTLSSMGGVMAIGSKDLGYAKPFQSHSRPVLQTDITAYLRQLSILHAAGILTDEEFSAARERLFGS